MGRLCKNPHWWKQYNVRLNIDLSSYGWSTLELLHAQQLEQAPHRRWTISRNSLLKEWVQQFLPRFKLATEIHITNGFLYKHDVLDACPESQLISDWRFAHTHGLLSLNSNRTTVSRTSTKQATAFFYGDAPLRRLPFPMGHDEVDLSACFLFVEVEILARRLGSEYANPTLNIGVAPEPWQADVSYMPHSCAVAMPGAIIANIGVDDTELTAAGRSVGEPSSLFHSEMLHVGAKIQLIVSRRLIALVASAGEANTVVCFELPGKAQWPTSGPIDNHQSPPYISIFETGDCILQFRASPPSDSRAQESVHQVLVHHYSRQIPKPLPRRPMFDQWEPGATFCFRLQPYTHGAVRQSTRPLPPLFVSPLNLMTSGRICPGAARIVFTDTFVIHQVEEHEKLLLVSFLADVRTKGFLGDQRPRNHTTKKCVWALVYDEQGWHCDIKQTVAERLHQID